MFAREADSKPNRTKIAILLSATGPDALESYNHFKWDDPPVDPREPADADQQGNVQPVHNNVHNNVCFEETSMQT